MGEYIGQQESEGNCTFSEVLENGMQSLNQTLLEFTSSVAEFEEFYELTADNIDGTGNSTQSGDELRESIVSINRILKGMMKEFTLDPSKGTPDSQWYKQLLFKNGN